MGLECASMSMQGTSNVCNSDGVLADPARALFAIADGLGGSVHGKMASATAIGTLRSWALGIEAAAPPEAALDALRACFVDINTALLNMARQPANSSCTTLTAVIVRRPNLLLVHSGDSRAYLVTGQPLRAEQLTDDHTVVGDMVREGLMDEAQAHDHPRRNILTACLGMHDQFRMQIQACPFAAEQVLILCSDGVWGYVRNADIAACAPPYLGASQIARQLITRARENHSPDDMSAVVVKLSPALP